MLSTKQKFYIILIVFFSISLSGCANMDDVLNSIPSVLCKALEYVADVFLFFFSYVFSILGEHLVPLVPGDFFRANLMPFYITAAFIAFGFSWILYLISLQTYTIFNDGLFSPATSILRLGIATGVIFLIPTIFGGLCHLFELIAYSFFNLSAPGDTTLFQQLSNFQNHVKNSTSDPNLSNITAATGMAHEIIVRAIGALIKIVICCIGSFFCIKILLLKGAQLVNLFLSFILAPFAAAGIAHKTLEGWFYNWFRQLCVLLLYSTIWAIGLKLIYVASKYPELIGPNVNKTALFLSPFMVLGILGIMTKVDSYAEQLIGGVGDVAGAANSGGHALQGAMNSAPAQKVKGAVKEAATSFLSKGAMMAGKAAAGIATGGTSVAAGAMAMGGSKIMSMAASKLGKTAGSKLTNSGVNKYLKQHSKYSTNQLKKAYVATARAGKNISNTVTTARRAIGLTRQIPGQNSPVQTKNRNRNTNNNGGKKT